MYNATIKACSAISAESFAADIDSWSSHEWDEFVSSFFFYADKDEQESFK